MLGGSAQRNSVSARQRRWRNGFSTRPALRYEPQVTYALKIVALVAIAGFLFANVVGFVTRVSTVGLILVAAVFFAYIVYPAIETLSRRFRPAVAIAIVYSGLSVVLGFALWVVIPIAVQNATEFIASVPALISGMESALIDPHNPVLRHLPPQLSAEIAHMPDRLAKSTIGYGSEVATRTFTLLVSTFSLVALFIVIPVVAAYLILDAARLRKALVGAIPRRARVRTLRIIVDIDVVVGGFVRGQLIVAAIVGTLVTLLLVGLHVKYAVLIGVLAGIFDIVPYVGAVAGWLPAVFVALFTNGWQNALLVTLGIVIINQVEGNLIVPRIVSSNVGLAPLAVIVALLIGGELFGAVGLLIAVPIAGIIRVLITDLWPAGVEETTAPPSDPAPSFSRAVRADRSS